MEMEGRRLRGRVGEGRDGDGDLSQFPVVPSVIVT